jgi:hypothetical protein
MEGIPANYLGRLVSKVNFRAFIYDPYGNSKLVNSWDEFESHMASGLWFASIEEAKQSVKPKEDVDIEKPKFKKK